MASAPVEALDTSLTHQPGDSLVVDRHAEPEGQLGVHPRPPIGAARLGMNTFDVFEQQLILLHPGGLHPGAPFVESLAAHAQYPTGHRDVETVVGEFTDQREDYFGRTFSRAKYAAARLRISFSISRRRLSLRSCASSRFSSLVNRDDEPPLPALLSAESCAIQFRRHDSEIRRSFAIAATGCSPRRTNSTARRRNSGGCGAGTNDILPGGPGPPQVTCPAQGAKLSGESSATITLTKNLVCRTVTSHAVRAWSIALDASSLTIMTIRSVQSSGNAQRRASRRSCARSLLSSAGEPTVHLWY